MLSLSLISLLLLAFHLATSTFLSISNFLFSLSLCILCGWAGAAGHVDSLSLLFCLRENCHPCHSGLWTQHGECMYVCLCVCVLTRLWQCGVRGFICSARNSWMHTHSHTPLVCSEWLKHDASSTTSIFRGRAFREQNFTPEDMSLQQRDRGLYVCEYTQAQENRLWPLYINNIMTSMLVVLCIAINSHWISLLNKTGIINSIVNRGTAKGYGWLQRAGIKRPGNWEQPSSNNVNF